MEIEKISKFMPMVDNLGDSYFILVGLGIVLTVGIWLLAMHLTDGEFNSPACWVMAIVISAICVYYINSVYVKYHKDDVCLEGLKLETNLDKNLLNEEISIPERESYEKLYNRYQDFLNGCLGKKGESK